MSAATTPTPAPNPTPTGERRGAGDHGSGLVAGLVFVFAFTFLGLVWLARDVDRSVSNRTAAQSIAFQAARSGAQQIAPDTLRARGAAQVDPAAARGAVANTASRLFASYGVAGRVHDIRVDGDAVTVAVTITDTGRTVTGVGTVRAERGP